MNYQKMIENEGYRREDLTAEHREQLAWLDFARRELSDQTEDILDAVANYEDNIIARVKKEVAEETMAEALRRFDFLIAEAQIRMAESEGVEQ